MKSSLIKALLTLAFTSSVPAAVITSGLRDIVITNNLDGVYLDVDAGTSSSLETVGWDINPFFGGEAVANSPAFQPARTTIVLDAPILRLGPGQVVDGTLNYLSGYGGSETQVGNGVGQFANGVEGYIGFRFTTNASVGPYFGWMRVVLSNDGSTGLIRDWAYENTGSSITIPNAVPEPSAFCVMALGAFSLCLRRTRGA